MNNKMKKALLIAACAIVTVGLIAAAPISRLVYTIYDTIRTNGIIRDLENKKNNKDNDEEEKEVNRKAFYKGSADGYTFDFLALIDDKNFELAHYERTENATTVHYQTQGEYTLKNNVVTITDVSASVSTLYKNGEYKSGSTAETRKALYDGIYSDTSFALQSDGTFTVGGKSDTEDEIKSKAEVYFLYDESSRPTYKSITVFDDNTYIAYCFALNSKNHEEAAGTFIGRGEYTVKKSNVAPNEDKPDETYDVLSLKPGFGYDYANNNGSLMGFDCITEKSFEQWFMLSLSGAATAEIRTSKTGYSYSVGAKTETFGKWSVSFVDIGSTDEPEENEDIKLEVETSVEGKPFVLSFKADGTLETGWTNYPTTIKEAKWFVFDGKIVLDLADAGYSASIDGNEIAVDYGQMGVKKYTLTAEQKANILAKDGDITSEVATSDKDNPFVLTFKADGTLETGWTKYAQTIKSASWSVADGALSFDMGETGYTVKVNGNEIAVNYGQMGEKTFTLTDAQLNALKSVEFTLFTAEVATSVADKPFVLTFKKNGTLETGWTNYPGTVKSASWSVVDGALSFDMGETGYTVKVNDNEIAVTYGQMGEKVYALTDEQLKLLGVSLDITLEVETSVQGKPFVLTFKNDGTLETGWTNYPTTIKSAKWYAFGNKLVLELDGTNYSATVNGKEIKVSYGQMGEKTFTLTDAQLARLLKNTADITSEVATSVEGKPFVLTFKADGTIETGWTNYPTTIKSASWSVVDGALSLDMGETGYTVKVNGKEIAVNYGQMGEKTFTLTDAQLATLLG